MASMTISKNKTKIGRVFSSEMATEYAMAGVGAIVYTVLPTALNWNGPQAMTAALVPCIALGVWLESPTLLAGTLFVALVHLVYKYGSNVTMKWWGRTIWSLDPATPSVPTDLKDYVQYIPRRDAYGMSDEMQLPNGFRALALPPADAPAPSQAPSQMNDYVTHRGEPLMDDEGFLTSTRYEQNGSFETASMFE